MNGFRLVGDLLHLLSILLLIHKILKHRSCSGISLKSIQLYFIVFLTRYIDLVFTYISLYNSCMKLFYIISTGGLIYLIRNKFNSTYDHEHDNFKLFYLIVPSFILALIFNDEFTIIEVLWAFSIYLESVAILPQLLLLQRTKEIDNITADYVGALGAYRFFYILNWIYRYYVGDFLFYHAFVYICGVVQTALFVDFFYYYLKSRWYGQKIVLPT